MRKIYIIPILAIILSSLILVGCSSPPSTPAAQPTTQAPATTQAVTSAPATSTAPTTSAASATSSPTVTSGKVYDLRFAHQNPPNGRTTVKYLDVFAQQIEKATNGRVKITMYPSSSLAPANQMLQAVQGGVADMTWSILGYYTNRFPLTSVMALPFMNLPDGQVDGQSLSGGSINSYILEKLYLTEPAIQQEWKDFKVLFLQSTDPYLLFTSKKEIHNLTELKGLKLRELGGYPSDMWEALGASPLTMAMPDVYDALQKGVIDGANLPWAAVSTMKLYEVLKYYTVVYTTVSPMFIIMNLNTWNSLPKDIQDQIMSVSGIPGAEFAGQAGWGPDVKSETLAAAKKEGYTLQAVQLDPGQEAKWKSLAGQPIWDKWVSDMNAKGLPAQKILDAATSLIKQCKSPQS